jgi:hypothetical protein
LQLLQFLLGEKQGLALLWEPHAPSKAQKVIDVYLFRERTSSRYECRDGLTSKRKRTSCAQSLVWLPKREESPERWQV